jgi:hypothetical protein
VARRELIFKRISAKVRKIFHNITTYINNWLRNPMLNEQHLQAIQFYLSKKEDDSPPNMNEVRPLT